MFAKSGSKGQIFAIFRGLYQIPTQTKITKIIKYEQKICICINTKYVVLSYYSFKTNLLGLAAGIWTKEFPVHRMNRHFSEFQMSAFINCS